MSSPGIDFSRIQEVSRGDREFENELFKAYFSDCDAGLSDLLQAVEIGDLDSARKHAHAIKGASINIGTTRLHEYAHAIESGEAIQESQIDAATLTALQVAYDEVKAAIRTYIKG